MLSINTALILDGTTDIAVVLICAIADEYWELLTKNMPEPTPQKIQTAIETLAFNEGRDMFLSIREAFVLYGNQILYDVIEEKTGVRPAPPSTSANLRKDELDDKIIDTLRRETNMATIEVTKELKSKLDALIRTDIANIAWHKEVCPETYGAQREVKNYTSILLRWERESDAEHRCSLCGREFDFFNERWICDTCKEILRRRRESDTEHRCGCFDRVPKKEAEEKRLAQYGISVIWAYQENPECQEQT